MAFSRTKLSNALSAEELEAFCLRLTKEPGLTGERLMQLSAEMGVEIGHSGAAVFINKEFKPFLEKLRQQKTLARMISEEGGADAASTIADAAAGKLSQDVFEFLHEADVIIDLDSEEGQAKAKTLSLVIARMRQGDHRLRALELKIAERDAEIAAVKAAVEKSRNGKKGGGMSAEAIAEMELQLGWKAPTKEAA